MSRARRGAWPRVITSALMIVGLGGTVWQSGCFEPVYERCQIRCASGQGPRCPDGLSCGTDEFCHAAGDAEVCTDVPPARAIVLGARNDQSCALADGDLRCWGNNQYEQLGVPSPSRLASPTPVGTLKWKRLAVGGYHGCGITASDELQCWGDHSSGQTGQGSSPIDRGPAAVVTEAGSGPWERLAAGDNFTVAIRGGSLVAFGANAVGQLGLFGPEGSDVALEIDSTRTYREVFAGDAHACALTDADELFCWGNGGGGRLGSGDEEILWAPTQIAADKKWFAVSAGGWHTCAIERDMRSLWCWGDANEGQTGSASSSLVPVVVDDSKRWAAVGVGLFHSCAIDEEGRLFCFGSNQTSALGTGDRSSGRSLKEVLPLAEGVTFVGVVGGTGHTCATTSDSRVVCFGDNRDGACGTGAFSNQWEPVQVGEAQWETLSVGARHVCGLRISGTERLLECWGDGLSGQLGNAAAQDAALPTAVATALTDWKDLAAGSDHTCAVSGADAMVCFGNNDFGQLGAAASVPKLSPLTVTGAWRAVAAGFGHTCAIDTADNAWCFGWNESGQLGTGSAASQESMPAQLAGTGWSSITAGADRSCGIAGGQLSCWGGNDHGEAGIGMVSDRVDTPTPVATTGIAFTAVAVASGSTGFAAAVGNDEAYTWGSNVNGVLGGSGPDVAVPSKLVGAGSNNVAEVCVGDFHGCSLASGGALYCWGYSSDGQVGVGEQPGPAPLEISRPSGPGGWKHLACGGKTTCATDTVDALWCWGRGGEGQLGLGDAATNPSRPRVVVIP